jgi:imidazolonepropionase-like amidohydrolase
MTVPDQTLIIRAPRLFDAAGNEYRDGASVWVEGKHIKAVYGREAPPPPRDARVLDFPDGCILPGLMDSHTHLMYGTAHRMQGPKSYDYVNAEDSDTLMLLRTVRNGYRHMLKSGVTTLRDAGSRNRITFDLKEGISAGLFRGFPTLPKPLTSWTRPAPWSRASWPTSPWFRATHSRTSGRSQTCFRW